MWWSWNEAYSVLQEAVHHLEEQDPQHIKEFLKTKPLKRAEFNEKAVRAATAGTIAHNLVDQWIHGKKVERSNLERLSFKNLASRKKVHLDIAKKAHTSFQSFTRWAKTTQFELHTTELKLTSNEYGFGGTLDCVGWLDNTLVLLDWKTSKGIYVDYLVQLGAYALLWNENYSPEIEQGNVALFHKASGDFKHFEFQDLKTPGEIFLLMLKAYKLVKPLEKDLR